MISMTFSYDLNFTVTQQLPSHVVYIDFFIDIQVRCYFWSINYVLRCCKALLLKCYIKHCREFPFV